MSKVSKVTLHRRRFLLGGVAAGVAGALPAAALRDGELGAPSETIFGMVPWREGAADVPPVASGTSYTFFNPAEAAFVEAAIAQLIPNDELGPGGVEAGVPFFIDHQLAGPYGRGDHFYLGGPWDKGTPEQGWQSRFSPAQLYRASIPAVEQYVGTQHNGATFAKLSPPDQVQLLKALESGDAKLEGGADAKLFFSTLLQNAKEGYFGDPIYGGNRDMGAWKMIGFPGAHYDYKEWVTRHNERVTFEPVSLKGRAGWRQG
jgi:gluconate 2-dehydrogenase gamma chain